MTRIPGSGSGASALVLRFPLVDLLPSADSAANAVCVGFVRPLRWYYAVVRLPQTFMSTLRLLGFFDRPPHLSAGVGGSPGSRAWSFPTCLGSLTPRVHRSLAPVAALDVAFPVSRHGVGTPNVVISGLHILPACTPVNASPTSLTTDRRMTRGPNGSLLLSCGLFHPLFHAGLSRRIFDHFIRPLEHLRANLYPDSVGRF